MARLVSQNRLRNLNRGKFLVRNADSLAARMIRTLVLTVAICGTACAVEPTHSLGDSVNLGPRAKPKPGDRGGELFAAVCAVCHENLATRAPSPAMLSLMSPHSIVRTLTIGLMQVQGKSLSPADKVLVAQYLTGHEVGQGPDQLEPPSCPKERAAFDFDDPPALTGWGIN